MALQSSSKKVAVLAQFSLKSPFVANLNTRYTYALPRNPTLTARILRGVDREKCTHKGPYVVILRNPYFSVMAKKVDFSKSTF